MGLLVSFCRSDFKLGNQGTGSAIVGCLDGEDILSLLEILGGIDLYRLIPQRIGSHLLTIDKKFGFVVTGVDQVGVSGSIL